MNLKTIIFLFFIISFISCNQNKNIETIYEDGKIKEIHFSNNANFIDSSYYYNEEGITKIFYLEKDTIQIKNYSKKDILISEGKKINNQNIGLWNFYSTNKQLNKIIEYKYICDSSYLNQAWHFKDGLLDNRSSNYYTILSAQKYKKGEKFKLNIYYNKLLCENSKVELYFSSKIDSTYCNINNIELMWSEFLGDTLSTSFLVFKSIGNKNIRGIIKEECSNDISNNKEKNYAKRILFFEIPIVIE
jgi:hypothetical protein